MANSFRFKQFVVENERSAMKVGTDGVLLGAWVPLDGEERRILDVGTGTGVIALMLTQRNPYSTVIGIDIDNLSVEEAEYNFKASPWSDRLTAVHSDFRSFAEKGFDLVVSNPPFFINSLKAPSQRRSAARHNDTLSQDDLIDGSFNLLSEKGRLAVVLPSDEGALFIEKCREHGLYLSRICKVSTKPGASPKRYLMEFQKNNERLIEETLIIQDSEGYTVEYRKLTGDFYLAF